MNTPLRLSIRPLTGADLKYLAMGCMLVDHIAAILLAKLSPEITGGCAPAIPWLVFLMRAIGRLAMPLYCFLLVEGFAHTKNLRKYIASVAVFAVLSEIPFNLANSGTLFLPNKNNTMFTLLIGLLFMYADQRLMTSSRSLTQLYIRRMAVFTAACLLAQFTFCDYGAVGILLIGAFYFPYTVPASRDQIAGIVMALESVQYLCAAALALFPISAYNGERGNIRHPYFFYLFYPAHLLLLAMIARALSL